MRKIIQVVTSRLRETVGELSKDYTVLIVLCDDGTLWQMGDTGWVAIEKIPE